MPILYFRITQYLAKNVVGHVNKCKSRLKFVKCPNNKLVIKLLSFDATNTFTTYLVTLNTHTRLLDKVHIF